MSETLPFGPMRQVVCTEEGPPEALVVAERDQAPCGPTQVRVEVRAAGLNFVDALFVQGRYQIRPAVPFVPGSELAGVVTEAGAAVDGVAVGDRVLASIGLGAFAEEVVIDAAALTTIPDGVTDGQAATLGQSYCTAVFALERRARVGPGQKVLVLGAGGGVGLASIDVATSLDATVIAAASSEAKRRLAVAAGADAVIDTSSEPVKDRARELSGGGVDVAVDPVGGDLSEAALRALGNDGQLLIIGFASGTIASLPANQVLLRNRRVVGIDWGAWALSNPEENRALLATVLERVAAGTYRPVEPTTYPLDAADTALRDLLERRITGKAVLVP